MFLICYLMIKRKHIFMFTNQKSSIKQVPAYQLEFPMLDHRLLICLELERMGFPYQDQEVG